MKQVIGGFFKRTPLQQYNIDIKSLKFFENYLEEHKNDNYYSEICPKIIANLKKNIKAYEDRR